MKEFIKILVDCTCRVDHSQRVHILRSVGSFVSSPDEILLAGIGHRIVDANAIIADSSAAMNNDTEASVLANEQVLNAR
jgi:hypothetical protein